MHQMKKRFSCESGKSALFHLGAGRLSDQEAAQLYAHLATCRHCRSLLASNVLLMSEVFKQNSQVMKA